MTATESNHRKGLTPWWRTRSWSRDLDTLSRLHKGLRALDADEEAGPLAARVLADPASGPDADGEAAQPDDQPSATAGQQEETAGEQEEPEERDKPEAAPAPDSAPARVPAEPGPAPEPDPAITAIRETFRYIADAGDKAVGYFYGQLFLRQPHLRQLSRPTGAVHDLQRSWPFPVPAAAPAPVTPLATRPRLRERRQVHFDAAPATSK